MVIFHFKAKGDIDPQRLSPGVGLRARSSAGSLAPPGSTQLPLHVLAVEEVSEEELVLVQTAVGDDQRERPLHCVLQ